MVVTLGVWSLVSSHRDSGEGGFHVELILGINQAALERNKNICYMYLKPNTQHIC